MTSKKRSTQQAVSPCAPQPPSGTPREPLPLVSADGARAHPAPDAAPTLTNCAALTDETCDLVAELSEMFKAYLALERLVSPEHEDECQANVQPSRAELGALLYVVNVEIQRRIRALAETTTALQRGMAAGQ